MDRASISCERGASGEELRELCHELRHPSATIRALAAALELECSLPAQAQARLDQIVAEARRIDQLCSHMLHKDFDSNTLVRLDRIAADVVRSPGAGRCSIDLLCSPVVARIDETSARQIVWNLLDNACRAAGPDGNVLVAVWSTNSRICLEVSDDGPGFGNGPAGMATLGLSIVRGLAQRYQGRVEVGSGQGGGAVVTVVLPPPRLDLVAAEEGGLGDRARAAAL